MHFTRLYRAYAVRYGHFRAIGFFAHIAHIGLCAQPCYRAFRVVLPPDLLEKKGLELKIYGSDGRLVRQMQWNDGIKEMQVETPLWPSGHYYLTLFGQGSPMASGKIILH